MRRTAIGRPKVAYTGWPPAHVLDKLFIPQTWWGRTALNCGGADRTRAVARPEAGLLTPRELRHSFVSLLSDAGVPVDEISRLVGHSGTSVTELVYRHQIRPVIQTGATVMDRLFYP